MYYTPEGVPWRMRGVVNKPGIVVIGLGHETEFWARRNKSWSFVIEKEHLPAWSRVDSLDEEHFAPYYTACFEYAVGWPFLALYNRRHTDGVKQLYGNSNIFDLSEGYFEQQESIAIATRIRDRLMQFRAHDTLRLPVLPIWSGVVLNVLFYASLWMGGLFVMRRVLGRWRVARCRKRGVCVTRGCGYELKGLGVCPECGEAQGERGASAQAPSLE